MSDEAAFYVQLPGGSLVPEGIRAVKMYRDLWEGDGMGLRTWDGRALTIEWGEPDAEGWWTPVFTAHEPSEAQRVEQARADLAARIVAAVSSALQPKTWYESETYADVQNRVLDAIREAAK